MRAFLSLILIVGMTACQTTPDTTVPTPPADRTGGAATPAPDPRFAAASDEFVDAMLATQPEWAIYQGWYENAGELTVPDAAYFQSRREFYRRWQRRFDAFSPESLPADQRTDLVLIENEIESSLWQLNTFRPWDWMPSVYNVAGPIGLILNTDFAPEDERLRLVSNRLKDVPAYYAAARENLDTPTLEHTDLAIAQNSGALDLLGQGLSDRIAASGLSAEEKSLFTRRLGNAQSVITDWIDWLTATRDRLEAEGSARSFRIGEALYQEKFRYDIQSSYTARELYERALAEKEKLHQRMDQITRDRWSAYFPDTPMPRDRLERVGMLIDHLSARHVDREDFIAEIRNQVPRLADFVRENDLLDQDPTRPLVIRETPLYMRGGGAGASVSSPGPFNPEANTYYNVTPLDDYTAEEAESYLREYNHWILQILNIHEAIPGHYTQLLHANKSPSLIKSLFGNGAMVEGWAVYAERMMLEQGWGNDEPEMWLMYGKWNLRVVCNAILDYAVHVKGMTQDEAMHLLTEEAFQERTEATNKWRRVRLSQVQLTSYFAGYAEIYDFREQRKARLGDDFDLKRFHNEFLSYGSAPVSVIRELMVSK